jgi:hypothetical protein
MGMRFNRIDRRQRAGLVSESEVESWRQEWVGMPEYVQEDLASFKSVSVNFENQGEVDFFSNLIGRELTDKTKSIWYPEAEIRHHWAKQYMTKKPLNPRYPVYIVSKGRWESRLTSKAFERMNLPYYIVVEKQEYDNYAAVIDPKKILVLPVEYLKKYDVFDNLGESKSKGPGAARNFCWDHSISLGAKRHWVHDDNIDRFDRLNHNYKRPVGSGAIFRAAEDFVDRYENVAISGFQYDFFIPSKDAVPPYALNTRIYSQLLIQNDIPYRWRGRYNEDTDLCLRVLKDGWCTVLFYAFIQEKATTQTVPGGCSKEFYDHEGTLPKSKILQDMHPDVSRVVWRFHRWHHYVDYTFFKSPWRSKLKRKPGVVIPEGINDYGMFLEDNPRFGGEFKFRSRKVVKLKKSKPSAKKRARKRGSK